MPRAPREPRRVPRQARSRELVDAIFEAMLQVIERQDLTDPSVQAVAERAGVSVGSIYQYFPSKDSLVSALIGFHLRRKMQHLEQALRHAEGLADEPAAELLVSAVLDDKLRHSRVERALLRAFTRSGDLDALTQYDEQMIGLVRRFLERLGPRVRQTDPGLAAFVLSNALRSAVLLSAVQAPERLADPAFKAELVRLVLGYLRP